MEKVIYIGGTFDCLHSGHTALFRRAKLYGRVVVSLNTDAFVERYKRKPLMPFSERMAILKELKCVDEVVVNFGDEDSKPAIIASGATHILHGDDWIGDALMDQMGLSKAFLEEHGLEMLYLPYSKGVSTTKILSDFLKNRFHAIISST